MSFVVRPAICCFVWSRFALTPLSTRVVDAMSDARPVCSAFRWATSAFWSAIFCWSAFCCARALASSSPLTRAGAATPMTRGITSRTASRRQATRRSSPHGSPEDCRRPTAGAPAGGTRRRGFSLASLGRLRDEAEAVAIASHQGGVGIFARVAPCGGPCSTPWRVADPPVMSPSEAGTTSGTTRRLRYYSPRATAPAAVGPGRGEPRARA